MILELTKENLQKCGFDEVQIVKLLEWDNYKLHIIIDTCYYATNIEKKIYTEIDGFKKVYFEIDGIKIPYLCPDLIPDYFDLAMNDFLVKQNELLNKMFVETDQKKKFILTEIENIKNSIEVLKEDLKNRRNFYAENKSKQINILDSYIGFLENKMSELSTLETDIWYSEYELRQSIDTAVRWPIKTVYQNKNENNPYSVFAHYINNQSYNYGLFCNQLKKRLTDNNNWKVIEIDLYNNFILMLDLYIEWYNSNKEETEIFGNYNPYDLIFSFVESTKKEILKFFPEIYKLEQPQQIETIKIDEVAREMHPKIFVKNAFDIWEQMFECFKINKTKRTDLSFMYEVMLYDKLIHETVSKKNIEGWINETYKFEIDKIHYTNIKSSANEKRMTTYNLLKQSK